MTVEQKYRRIQYQLANARTEKKIKLKDLPQAGICEKTFRRVVYGNCGSSILSVMRVAEGLGYELVLRRLGE